MSQLSQLSRITGIIKNHLRHLYDNEIRVSKSVTMSKNKLSSIEIYPVMAEHWQDLERLFGNHGAYANCWCTFWLLKRTDFKAMSAIERKAVLQTMTCENQVPGMLAYAGDEPVGWCSAGPCERYLALEASRVLKRIDDQEVWSVVCFYIARSYRRKGLMEALLRGVLIHAQTQGASIVEGYPIDLQSSRLVGKNLTGYSGFMGIASVFREVGFVEVGRASETQLIMRYYILQSAM
jgi:GNAT superfamily N-acetyltransferase